MSADGGDGFGRPVFLVCVIILTILFSFTFFRIHTHTKSCAGELIRGVCVKEDCILRNKE
jgi:preprotein translocase subunit SecY